MTATYPLVWDEIPENGTLDFAGKILHIAANVNKGTNPVRYDRAKISFSE